VKKESKRKEATLVVAGAYHNDEGLDRLILCACKYNVEAGTVVVEAGAQVVKGLHDSCLLSLSLPLRCVSY
jgi:hypothetical protein